MPGENILADDQAVPLDLSSSVCKIVLVFLHVNSKVNTAVHLSQALKGQGVTQSRIKAVILFIH